MRMNEKEFWEFIESTKINTTRDISNIVDRLRELEYEKLIDFALHFENILEVLDNSNKALTFAEELNSGSIGDDSWLYFRSWLIYQGKDTVLKAMTNPDSLVDIYKSTPKDTESYLSLFINLYEYIFEDMDEGEIIEIISESKWKDIWDNANKIDRSNSRNLLEDLERTKIYGQITFSNADVLDRELVDKKE